MTSVDMVWNTLIIQLNKCINALAPSKIIRLKKNFVPYMSCEIQDKMDKSDEALTIVLADQEQEKWIEWHSLRNQALKKIESRENTSVTS